MKDLNDYVNGNTLQPADFNEIPSEIQNAITNSGQTLSSGDLTQLGKAIGSISFDNKSAAVLVAPINNKSYFIGGTDGGWFKGVTGAAAGTYSDNGGSYCGTQFIPTGGDGSAAYVRDDKTLITPQMFGAVGDGTTDDTMAFTNAAAAGSRFVTVPFSASGYNVANTVSAGSSMFLFLGGYYTTQLIGTATIDDVNGISLHAGQISARRLRLEPEDNTLTGTNEGSKRGLFISQAEPDLSSIDYGDGPFAFNEISCNWSGERTGTGLDGGPTSASVSGLSVSLNAGGSAYELQSAKALAIGLMHDTADTSDGDKVGISSGVTTSASSSGKIYGGSFSHTIETGSTVPVAVGVEVDSLCNGGSTIDLVGFHALSMGSQQSSRTHAAYALGRAGGGAVGWKTGFMLYSDSGNRPSALVTTGNLFDTDANVQLNDIFSFSNVTVDGNILDFPNTTLTGDGYFKTVVTTVAGLNSAVTEGAGARAFVTDATTTTFASTVVGGGSNNVPVYSDGTNWKIG